MANKTGKNGLIPDASLQVAVGMAQADMAYRISRSQAARGVPTGLAAEHGAKAATAVFAYAIFIFPILMVTALFVWTPNPIIMLWKTAQVITGMVILLRMHKWIHEPATNVLVYKISTLKLVVGGGISVLVFFLFAVYRILTA